MSKQVYVTTQQPDPEGPIFSRAASSTDFMAAQDFMRQLAIAIVKNLLVAGAAGPQVAGFAATRTGGLNLSIAKGEAFDVNGVHYETDIEEGDGSTPVTLDAAHVSLPRIDLVIATVTADVPVKDEFKPHRRVRTLAELQAIPPVPPYPPDQFNVPTELHSRAVISVKTGVPNASPAAPAAGAGEVPLWQIHVAAGQTVINSGDLTDRRNTITSLFQVLTRLIALEGIVSGSSAGLVELIQDTVGAFLSSPDPLLTLTYDDVSNAMTIATNNGNLVEKVQDIVGAFAVAGDGSLTVTYNDAGNALTFVLAAAYKALLDGATSAATASALVKRASDKGIALDGHTQIGPVIVGPSGSKLDVQDNTNGDIPLIYIRKNNPTGGESGHCVLIAGNCNAVSVSTAGVLEIVDWNTVGATGSGNLLRLMGVQSAAAALAFRVQSKGDVYVGRDLQVVGTLSKGAGTFDIDHPLDPDNKDLVYSFLEGPRPYLLFSGVAKLKKGRAVVDLDVESNQMPGTFAALTKNAHGHASNLSKDPTNFDRVRLLKIEDGKATIICENLDADFEVEWEVKAERNDAFIRACHLTDEDSEWIVERTKEQGDPALLQPETRTVRAKEAAPDIEFDEIVTGLVGTRGFPRHAQATGVGAVPRRRVTVKTEVTEEPL